jgi:acetyl esterase
VLRYLPPSAPPVASILHIHGGGWVFGSARGSSGVCTRLAALLAAEIWSVDYSLSPEAAPGVALDECALAWSLLPPALPAFVLGDSAGGNLAAALALRLAAGAGRRPDGAVLVYPVADLANESYDSWRRFADNFSLTADRMRQFTRTYVPRTEERGDPRFSPIRGCFVRFPPTLVVAAQLDILRDEARALAARIRDAGRPVRYTVVAGAIHGFFSNTAMPASARVADREIAEFVGDVRRAGRAQPRIAAIGSGDGEQS